MLLEGPLIWDLNDGVRVWPRWVSSTGLKLETLDMLDMLETLETPERLL
jgi:hypothetical protein